MKDKFTPITMKRQLFFVSILVFLAIIACYKNGKKKASSHTSKTVLAKTFHSLECCNITSSFSHKDCFEKGRDKEITEKDIYHKPRHTDSIGSFIKNSYSTSGLLSNSQAGNFTTSDYITPLTFHSQTKSLVNISYPANYDSIVVQLNMDSMSIEIKWLNDSTFTLKKKIP